MIFVVTARASGQRLAELMEELRLAVEFDQLWTYQVHQLGFLPTAPWDLHIVYPELRLHWDSQGRKG
jgi:hypothetical protein